MKIEIDQRRLDEAYREALLAFKQKEVPVGAILIKDEKLLAVSHNAGVNLNDNLAHAELLAIRKAQNEFGSEIIKGSALYVTLEPCLMCLGAMLNAGVSKVFFGALDPTEGAFSHFGVSLTLPEIEVHYLDDLKCSEIMSTFFQEIRNVRPLKKV